MYSRGGRLDSLSLEAPARRFRELDAAVSGISTPSTGGEAEVRKMTVGHANGTHSYQQ
jgi:hypothetical protein